MVGLFKGFIKMVYNVISIRIGESKMVESVCFFIV